QLHPQSRLPIHTRSPLRLRNNLCACIGSRPSSRWSWSPSRDSLSVNCSRDTNHCWGGTELGSDSAWRQGSDLSKASRNGNPILVLATPSLTCHSLRGNVPFSLNTLGLWILHSTRLLSAPTISFDRLDLIDGVLEETFCIRVSTHSSDPLLLDYWVEH